MSRAELVNDWFLALAQLGGPPPGVAHTQGEQLHHLVVLVTVVVVVIVLNEDVVPRMMEWILTCEGEG